MFSVLSAFVVVGAPEPSDRDARDVFDSPPRDRAVRRAAALVGHSDSTNLELVRELQMWRRRALDAEAKLQTVHEQDPARGSAGVAEAGRGRESAKSQGLEVVSALPAEKLLIFSSGRDEGIYEGVLVKLESGVVAKVLEARRGCCAAVVESSFRGNVAILEGQKAHILLR
jgi:hypothetical protein